MNYGQVGDGFRGSAPVPQNAYLQARKAAREGDRGDSLVSLQLPLPHARIARRGAGSDSRPAFIPGVIDERSKQKAAGIIALRLAGFENLWL
jgi:hypothetical protein